MRVIVTGGAGFIGSNFIRYILKKKPGWDITNIDALTYAGNLANLSGIEDSPKYKFIKGDISNPEDVERLFESEYDYLVNFAAETHVDRSLYEPGLFLKTNVLGTQLLLNYALEKRIKRFIQISTDEVYGSLESEGYFDESSPLSPNSPYAASKASADVICRSYSRTFDMPVIITRCGNNYGPYQFPEKVIPFFITKALKDEPLPLYGDGLNVRDWIHVEDHCDAILAVLEKGEIGEVYNIGGGNERTNLELTRIILEILGKPESLIKFVKDRPGHDRRYALNCDKIKAELGWSAQMDFADGLRKTVEWYLNNKKWCDDVISGEYMKFYELHYRERS
ncbi:MAG: dTDP-glucose 4,6-dehydratase [Candidatus Zixiibacteriota bacterium]|nr:MAG: dTDP-glucose 4,6-dehydratase [candidate division Zixibacteria bacterium]